MIIYYIFINLLYFCSFLFFGQKLSKIFKLEKNIEEISFKYFQYPIISIAFFAYITSILIQFNVNIKYLSFLINSLLISAGIFYIYKKRNFFKKLNITFLKTNSLIFIILISYLLFTLSPIIDADSLAYHAYFPKKILVNNQFYFDHYNFHEKLVGVMEFFYVVPLFIKSEYTLQLINFFSLLSIVSIFYKILANNQNKFKILILLILTSPIFIQLVYSAKPQLIFLSLSLLNFCLIYKQKKIENWGLITFSIFLIIFNILGKSSFLISSSVLSIFLFIKINENFKIKNFLKIPLIFIFIYVPYTFAKFFVLDTFNLNNLINYIPIDLFGYKEFWSHLINNAQKEDLFPLNLLFPLDLNSLSSSFGLWPIILFLLFQKDKYLIFPLLLFLLMILAGLKSNRFYLEPLLWVSFIFINNIPKKKKMNNYLFNLSILQTIPMTGLIVFISFYFFSANLGEKIKLNRLADHAYGFAFNQIINERIPSKNFIIYNLRTLYYGKNNLIYPEFTKYTNEKFYYREILKKEPKYLVLIDADIKDTVFKKCKHNIIYSSKAIGKVKRNNILKNRHDYKNKSIINIYQFLEAIKIDCLT